jgi:hypothetical protein
MNPNLPAFKNSELRAKARAIYAPVWAKLNKRVDHERGKYQTLSAKNHDEIGRVLKLHLIMEHYIEKFLTDQAGLTEQRLTKLTFAQKVQRLPDTGMIGVVKPGISSFNQVRNRFAHSLSTSLSRISTVDLDAIVSLLDEGEIQRSKIERIEAFCFLSFACLLVTPPKLASQLEAANKQVLQLLLAAKEAHDA